MNALMPLLSEGEKLILEHELEKLFAFQDKSLSKEKKLFLVDELSKSGVPIGALVQGARSLAQDEDVKSLKIPTILAEARSFVESAVEEGCEKCSRGFVVMRDDERHRFSLCCSCDLGQRRYQSHKYVQWNGQESQFSKGRMLYLEAPCPR